MARLACCTRAHLFFLVDSYVGLRHSPNLHTIGHFNWSFWSIIVKMPSGATKSVVCLIGGKPRESAVPGRRRAVHDAELETPDGRHKANAGVELQQPIARVSTENSGSERACYTATFFFPRGVSSKRHGYHKTLFHSNFVLRFFTIQYFRDFPSRLRALKSCLLQLIQQPHTDVH